MLYYFYYIRVSFKRFLFVDQVLYFNYSLHLNFYYHLRSFLKLNGEMLSVQIKQSLEYIPLVRALCWWWRRTEGVTEERKEPFKPIGKVWSRDSWARLKQTAAAGRFHSTWWSLVYQKGRKFNPNSHSNCIVVINESNFNK